MNIVDGHRHSQFHNPSSNRQWISPVSARDFQEGKKPVNIGLSMESSAFHCPFEYRNPTPRVSLTEPVEVHNPRQTGPPGLWNFESASLSLQVSEPANSQEGNLGRPNASTSAFSGANKSSRVFSPGCRTNLSQQAVTMFPDEDKLGHLLPLKAVVKASFEIADFAKTELPVKRNSLVMVGGSV